MAASLKENLRQSIVENHDFLLKVYRDKPHTVKRFLAKASNAELCILIKLLFALEEGLIPMKIRHYKILLRSKRMKPILMLKYDVKRMLRAPLAEKKTWLCQFCSLYKALLYPLFEDE